MMGAIDGHDVLVVLGLAMVGAGLWMISVPLALCVVGALLLAAGLLGAWRKSAKRGSRGR